MIESFGRDIFYKNLTPMEISVLRVGVNCQGKVINQGGVPQKTLALLPLPESEQFAKRGCKPGSSLP